MRCTICRVAFATLAATLIAPAAHAQFPTTQSQHPVRIGFGGGVLVPVGDLKSSFENGVAGQAYLLISLGGLPAIRVNVGYQKLEVDETTLPGAAQGDTRILGGVAGLKLDLLHGPFRPYVLAGVGAFNVKNTLESGGASSAESETKFGIDAGGGIAIKLGRIDAYAEAKIQNVYTEKGYIDTKSIRVVPVTFGILF